MAETEPTRVLVACMPKSGSTYVARVLALYLELEIPDPLSYWGRREQNLHASDIERLLDIPCVLQLHIKPYDPHIELIRTHNVKVVVLERNLGDVVVSLDDHHLSESVLNPACYVHDRGEYAAVPQQDRYRYLIRHALPWYIAFHLSWSAASQTLPLVACRYEDMQHDRFTFFARILDQLGFPVDGERLTAILARSLPGTRFNKGLTGRSLTLLSPRNQALLEEILIDHPQDLSALLDQLPWRKESHDANGETACLPWEQPQSDGQLQASWLKRVFRARAV
jgi:hypothetical protein